MTLFDRFAWLCSWCAPLGLAVGVVAFLANLGLRSGSTPALAVLPSIALGAGVLGLVAHVVLTVHVLNASFLTTGERSMLLRALHLRADYGRWRATMRGEVPS